MEKRPSPQRWSAVFTKEVPGCWVSTLIPQGNLAFALGLDIGRGHTVYDVLTGTAAIQEAVISTQYGDVLPSDIMLSTAEVSFTAPRREFMLAQQLNLLSGTYDFVVIDTPPALNILTINAYVASTSLIIPMEAEVLSLVGISQIQDTIEAVRESFNPGLKVLGILLNKFNARLTLSREILELAEEVACQLNSQVFPTKIRRGVGVAMAPAHGQSVLTYRPSSNPAQDLQRIVSIVAGDQFPLAEKNLIAGRFLNIKEYRSYGLSKGFQYQQNRPCHESAQQKPRHRVPSAHGQRGCICCFAGRRPQPAAPPILASLQNDMAVSSAIKDALQASLEDETEAPAHPSPHIQAASALPFKENPPAERTPFLESAAGHPPATEKRC